MVRSKRGPPGGRGSGCHFRPAAGVRLGHVKEHKVQEDFSVHPQISLGFYGIEVVVVARKEIQPAVQAASCAAASRLCRHSAQAHTP